ncbi:MAG: hypothetical protein ACYC11_13020 [Bellilinea sp.]
MSIPVGRIGSYFAVPSSNGLAVVAMVIPCLAYERGLAKPVTGSLFSPSYLPLVRPVGMPV